jgi:hypothetical protein
MLTKMDPRLKGENDMTQEKHPPSNRFRNPHIPFNAECCLAGSA